jgi:predicted nucleic acid-binding protein
MYCDSAYVTKYYVHETDSPAVRHVMEEASYVCSSAWAMVEVTSALHRHAREMTMTPDQCLELIDRFRTDVSAGFWNLMPVTETLLRKTANLYRSLPANVPLRSGDALHIATALDAGEPELWTNDRHLLAAANHFGLIGRSASR